MKSGKKVAIIVTIIVILLLLAGGVWAVNEYVINNPKDLFDKYTAQNLAEVFNFDTSFISKIENDNSGKTREAKTNIDFSGLGKNVKLEANQKVDKQNNKSELELDLKKDDNSILKLKGLNNSDKYAFTSEQIVNGYIGIENNKLDELAKKFNLNVENIPNKIEIAKGDYENDKKKVMTKLQEEYLPLVINKFSEEKYTKEKNVSVQREDIVYDKATKLTLNTNTLEIRDLIVELLNKAKEDDDLLDKIIASSVEGYKDEAIKQTKEQIDSLIKSLENMDENKNIKVDTYIYKNKAVKTDIVAEDNNTISMYPNGATKKIVMNMKSSTFDTVDEIVSSNSNATSTISKDIEYKVEFEIYNEVKENSHEIMLKVISNDRNVADIKANFNQNDNGSKVSLEVVMGDITIIKLNQETEYKDSIDIEELNSDNSVILNDMSQEEIQSLMGQLVPVVAEVFGNTVNEIVGLESGNFGDIVIHNGEQDIENNDMTPNDENM